MTEAIDESGYVSEEQRRAAIVHYKLAQQLLRARDAEAEGGDQQVAIRIGRQAEGAFQAAYAADPSLRPPAPPAVETITEQPPYVWEYEPFGYDQRL